MVDIDFFVGEKCNEIQNGCAYLYLERVCKKVKLDKNITMTRTWTLIGIRTGKNSQDAYVPPSLNVLIFLLVDKVVFAVSC